MRRAETYGTAVRQPQALTSSSQLVHSALLCTTQA